MADIKWSAFPDGAAITSGDEVVGLRAGANIRLTANTFDNLNLDTNTISSIDTDGDINITPDGSGNMVVSSNISLSDTKGIIDENGNSQLLFNTTVSAVNYVDLTNAATGSGPLLQAAGSDANIDLRIQAKGTGNVLFDGSDVIFGDPGTETSGINVNGVTYNSNVKSSEIGATNLAQFIMHRHSTTASPIMLSAHSNSDTSAHGVVTNGMNLSSNYASGWTGTSYSLFGGSFFDVDSTGTVSTTSAPGRWRVQVTPDGSLVPANALTITNDKTATFAGDVTVSSGTVDITGQFNVDNLRLDGNTVSTTNTNGNLVLTPNGIGNITSTRNIFLSSGVNSGVTTNVANTFAGTSSSAGYSFTTGSGVARLSSFSTAYTFELGLAGRVLLGSNASVTAGILLRPDAGGLTITTNGSVDDPNLLVDSSGNTSLSGSLSVTGNVTSSAGFIGSAGSVNELVAGASLAFTYQIAKTVTGTSAQTFLQLTIPAANRFVIVECMVSITRSIGATKGTSLIKKAWFSIGRNGSGTDVVLDGNILLTSEATTTTAGGSNSVVASTGAMTIVRNGAEGNTEPQVVNITVNPVLSSSSEGRATVLSTIILTGSDSGFIIT